MAKKESKRSKQDPIQLRKIRIVFRRSLLQAVMKILTMNSDMYRSFKAVKNINKLFTNLDLSLYKGNPELEAYIWCIQFFSDQWLKGVTTPDLIAEMAIRQPECDSLRRGVIEDHLGSLDLIQPQEAKETLEIVARSLQDGFIYTLKDDLIQKLEDFDITDISTVAKGRENVINAARTINDIYNSTTVIDDQDTFDTNDTDSIDYGIDVTIDSLQKSTSIFKTGIKRLNTLLSPGYLQGRLYVYEGLPASGKAQPDDTPIPTPEGMKRMDELEIGDEVFNRHGEVVHVTGVFPQGVQDTYEVTFADNRKTRCNKDHLWMVFEEVNGELIPYVMTLEDIERNNTYSDPDDPTKILHRYSIPNNRAAQFPHQEVPVDPYVMGYTMGDMPKEYIFNSEDVRLRLLQGLMEKGGSVSGMNQTYSTDSPKMRDDLMFLLRSLGIQCGCYTSENHYDVYISLPDEKHRNFIEIVDVKKVEPTSQRCITVDDKEHTYLTEDFIPTHNSIILLKSALDIRRYNLDYKPKKNGMTPCVLYITMENSMSETVERLWNMMFDDPIIHYSKEEAREMLKKELGMISEEDIEVDVKSDESLLGKLDSKKNKKSEMTIHIVIKYFKYRSISTADLYTIIQDLEDEKHMEVVCLVLDYIKRIEPSIVSHESVKLELNRITNELKALAVTKNIPVITAHQLNRAAAATIDTAVRQGQGDVTKLIGRENTGDAWEIVETADWVCIVNLEYKPGTRDKYLCFSVVKRRRVDHGDKLESKILYVAHPFAPSNGMRLLDDINNPKVLSLNSLSSDIQGAGREQTNAVPRKKVDRKDFEE